MVNNPPANHGIRSLVWEGPLEKEVGNLLQYSHLENPIEFGRLQSMGSQRVRHDLVTEKQQLLMLNGHCWKSRFIAHRNTFFI